MNPVFKDLSIRAQRIVADMGITDVSELAKKSIGDIRKQKYAGCKMVVEIAEFLRDQGFMDLLGAVEQYAMDNKEMRRSLLSFRRNRRKGWARPKSEHCEHPGRLEVICGLPTQVTDDAMVYEPRFIRCPSCDMSVSVEQGALWDLFRKQKERKTRAVIPPGGQPGDSVNVTVTAGQAAGKMWMGPEHCPQCNRNRGRPENQADCDKCGLVIYPDYGSWI